MAIAGPLKINAQILRDGMPAIGPGKLMVLDAIDRAGSISAAGRELGMSYRRVWLLVDALNRDWAELVVEARAGGGKTGGAALTPFGRELAATYRRLESALVTAANDAGLDALVGMMRPL